jgi:glycosyltransferase involved in cell wall biosynthesis
MRIVFIVSIYPKLSEKFILQEFYHLENLGVKGLILAFKPGKEKKQHPIVKKIKFEVFYFTKKVLQIKNFFRSFCLIIKYCTKNPAGFLKASHWLYKTKKQIVSNLRIFFKALLVLEKVQKFRPDLIVSHYGTEPTEVAVIFSYLLKITFGCVLHTDDLFVRNYYLSEKLKLAAFVVVKSKFSKKYLKRQFNIVDNIHILHLGGIDTKFFRPGKGLKKREKTIVFVGRLVEQKGLECLIEACSILKKDEPEFKCKIIGGGPEGKKIKIQVKTLDLGDEVKFLGPLPHDYKFLKTLSSADVFVLPSIIAKNNDRDILANSLCEAMACGIPVITTQISAINELIKDGVNGFLVPIGDSKVLAQRIKHVLSMDNKTLNNIGLRARRTIVKDFNSEKEAKKFLKVIGKAVGN